MDINDLVLESFRNDIDWVSSNLIKKIVREKITDLKKELGVNFDLENNDPTEKKRIISIPRAPFPDGTPRSPVKFICQMWQAGGDWEYPVIYFVCQIKSGSLNRFGKEAKFVSQYDGEKSFFCFIPLEHNRLKVINNKSWKYSAYSDSEDDKKDIPEPNKIKCWQQLTIYLERLVRKDDT